MSHLSQIQYDGRQETAKKGGVLSRSWKRVLGGFRRSKSSADGDARRTPGAEPPVRHAVSLNAASLADAERRNVVPDDSPKWLKSLARDRDGADDGLAELPTLPSTDGIEGFGSFGSGDGRSRDSESTLERLSISTPVTPTPLNVQRNLSATGRTTGRIGSEEFAAFVDAGAADPAERVIAPPINPRRPRVVRFNSVVDDS